MFRHRWSQFVCSVLLVIVTLNIFFASLGWDLAHTIRHNDPEIKRMEELHAALTALHKELHTIQKASKNESSVNEVNESASSPRIATGVNPTVSTLISQQVIKNSPVDEQNVTPKSSDQPRKPMDKNKSALIFTMDSIASYEQNSLAGGASGNYCTNVD